MGNVQIAVPVICENPHCRNFHELVNLVTGLCIDDADSCYETGFDGSDKEDYCTVCGELGIAQDWIYAAHRHEFFGGKIA